MAKREYNLDLDIKGSISATTVPNSTGSIVTWNSSTNVFGLRSNSQILSDLGLTSVVSNSHTHTNKSILDGITSAKVSNWDTAYGWGNFRDYGLGQGQATVGTWDLSQDYSGFVSNSGHGIPGWSTGRAWGFRTSYTSNLYGVELAMRNGRAAFQTRENGTDSGWNEFIHSGNINSYGFLTSINTIAFNTDAVNPTNNYNNLDVDTVLNSSRVYHSTSTNSPNNAGFLDTTVYSNGAFQMSQGDNDNFYYRRRFAGTWRSWNQVASREWVSSQNYLTSANLSGYVPYTGATQNLNLGTRTITTTGSLVNASNSSRLAINVLSFYVSSTSTGILSLKFPMRTTSATMFDVLIRLYGYTGKYSAEYRITFYKQSATAIHATSGITASISSSGNLPSEEINVGIEGSNICIDLGNETTSWSSHLSLSVDRLESKYSGWGQEYHEDWSYFFITDTSNYVVRRSITPEIVATKSWVTSQLPTVNNGQLTLSTGTGLTGSATFTANQSGNSSFSVGLSSSTLASLALANTAVQPSALSNYYQSGDVNIPALGGDYVVFPKTGSNDLLNFDFNTITSHGFYNKLFNSGAASTYNSPKSGFYGWVEVYNHAGNLTQYAHPYRVSDGKWMRSKFGSTWTPWVEFIHSGNLDTYATTLLTGFVPTSRTITAGNGLSGGGNLTANRTITLGTPTAITLSSTNSVTTSSHTHAFTPGGTTAQYIRGDGTLATLPTFTDAITSISRDGVNIPIVSQNVDIPIFSTSGAGLVPPRVGSVATKYLREDGTWVTPTNTTYSAGTLALLQAGTNTTNRIWSAKILADYVTSMIPTTSDGILSYSSANGIIVTDWNSFALSEYAMSLGYGSVTSGNYATSVGGLLSTTGFGSTNQGYSNSITKSLGYALGAYNSVRATLSGAFGIGLINRNDGAFVVGRYNSELPIEPYDTTSPHKQAVFAIGAGRDDTDRYTALTVYGDGRADYTEGYDDSNWTNNTLVTKKWVLDNVSGGGSGGGGEVGYRNVYTSDVFNLDSEYSAALAETIFHVMTDKPVLFIGGNAVFTDGYKITIMTYNTSINISLDNGQEVKFVNSSGSQVTYLDKPNRTVTFVYDKEYASFRAYHVSELLV